MKKYLILIIFTLSLFMVLPKDMKAAKTLGDLYDELYELETQKAYQENAEALTEAEYNRVSNAILESKQKIDDYNQKIIEATEEIARLEEEIKEKKKETDNILVFLQISNGEKSYLEYIFKATSFTDFIHRVSVVEQLSKYNKKLINEMNDLIKKNEDLKVELAENIKKEEAERELLQANLKKIGNRIAELTEEGANIDEQIEGQKNTIAWYEDLGCSDMSDVLSSCTGIPPSTGFLRPLPRGIVTSWYGYRTHPVTGAVYSYHSGVDISDSSPAEGKPVYPVASGVVAAKAKWSCGGQVLFIYHNVNGTNYTSIYMHLLSYNVDVGDIVSANDVIAYMGGYSTSTSHGGYDSCTTGAHVHLSLTTGHTTPGNYYSYLFDPTNLIYLPSGWFYSRSW